MDWGIARQFAVALNIATLGYWWWTPVDKDGQFYERIEDLQTKALVKLTNGPSLTMNWEWPLTEEDLSRLTQCMVALPGPELMGQPNPYGLYIAGLTFIALNDIHFRLAAEAFAAFFNALKGLMKEGGECDGDEAFPAAALKFLDQAFPGFDERATY
jgi:hypothetical protein